MKTKEEKKKPIDGNPATRSPRPPPAKYLFFWVAGGSIFKMMPNVDEMG
jgi:hypothetical protein